MRAGATIGHSNSLLPHRRLHCPGGKLPSSEVAIVRALFLPALRAARGSDARARTTLLSYSVRSDMRRLAAEHRRDVRAHPERSAPRTSRVFRSLIWNLRRLRRDGSALFRPGRGIDDHASRTLEGPIGPGPIDQDIEAVAKADQEEQVCGQPRDPGRPAPQAHPTKERNRLAAPYGGQLTVVPIAERCRRFALSAARRLRAACLPICFAAGATPGTRGRWEGMAARSPITWISGYPGTERSGSTITRPARSSGTPRVAPSGLAATPAHQMTVLACRRSPPRVPRHRHRSSSRACRARP
jgi:hypothetical protein